MCENQSAKSVFFQERTFFLLIQANDTSFLLISGIGRKCGFLRSNICGRLDGKPVSVSVIIHSNFPFLTAGDWTLVCGAGKF